MRDRIGRFELADRRNAVPRRDRRDSARPSGQAAARAAGRRTRTGRRRAHSTCERAAHCGDEPRVAGGSGSGPFSTGPLLSAECIPDRSSPLRKRKEDIPLLADHFLESSARKVGRPKPPLTLAGVQRLQQYEWPGNVRELQHVIERAVITSAGGRLNIELPFQAKAARVPEIPIADPGVRTDAQIRQIEADNIEPPEGSKRQGLRPRRRGPVAWSETHDFSVANQGVGNCRPCPPLMAECCSQRRNTVRRRPGKGRRLPSRDCSRPLTVSGIGHRGHAPAVGPLVELRMMLNRRFPGKPGSNCRPYLDLLFSNCGRNPASQPWMPARKSSNGVLSPRLFSALNCVVGCESDWRRDLGFREGMTNTFPDRSRMEVDDFAADLMFIMAEAVGHLM